ncbi:MAG: M20/M25/M40 family metallo-hydrolase, partial [Candidatus Cloacimonadaceae bacterium]
DVVKYFLELVCIDSESGNERKVADKLKADLTAMGAEVFEDEAYLEHGGNAGNVFARFEGNPQKEPILFCAHMDTVKPGNGIKPIITDGVIHTDGSTILGSDDKSGVAEIMIGIKRVIDSGKDHAPIEVLFTICEEIGLLGARSFDKSKIKAKLAYAFDSHEVGEVIIGAPSAEKFKIIIKGKEAHAGVEPENGINAIRVASEAIAMMPNGRIDHESTCNMGKISGGIATNIVPNEIVIHGEARSHDNSKLDKIIGEVKQALDTAVQRYQLPHGQASYEFINSRDYVAFSIAEDHPAVLLAKNALTSLGIEPNIKKGGGGSDANILNLAGISTLICGSGMDNVHTVRERIKVSELEKGADLVQAMIVAHSKQE